MNIRLFPYTAALLAALSQMARADCPAHFPEAPVITRHLEHADIVAGQYDFRGLFAVGEGLFQAKFNLCDGQGRPATTGTGDKRVADEPAFIRTSAPDANACVACHAEPSSGGSGDFVANVFVLAQARDPVVDSLSPAFSNERNSLGMHGSGAIEMLAREMTADLKRQAAGLRDGAHTLVTKGVAFEVTIAGGVVTDSVGVDKDLVIKPFHQAGVVVSLREFTVNAMNHHHGMQAEERFDLNAAKGFATDFDDDGVERELTTGDITAVTLYQAALGIPQRVLPLSLPARRSAQRGERVFAAIGCGECHVPALPLDDPVFAEPNPRNPAGTFADVAQTYRFDLTRQGEYPRLERGPKGGAIVRAYTDLKRHNLCDREGTPGAIRHFCNERLDQGRPAQGGRPGRELFLTRKLWDVGSSAPYGHRGDLTTITEAILAHGGEARAQRDRFAALAEPDQASVIHFLKSLIVVRADGAVLDGPEKRRSY
jgi:hypothetical protein